MRLRGHDPGRRPIGENGYAGSDGYAGYAGVYRPGATGVPGYPGVATSMRVSAITAVQRRSDGMRIKGLIDSGIDYRGGYGGQAYQGPGRGGQAYATRYPRHDDCRSAAISITAGSSPACAWTTTTRPTAAYGELARHYGDSLLNSANYLGLAGTAGSMTFAESTATAGAGAAAWTGIATGAGAGAGAATAKSSSRNALIPDPTGIFRARARHEEPGDGDERDRSDNSGGPSDALVIESAGQADQPVPDADIQHACGDAARFAPHALAANVGDFAGRRTSGRNDHHAPKHDVLRDLQHAEVVAFANGLVVRIQPFLQPQLYRRACAEHAAGRWREDHGLRSGRRDGRCRCWLNDGLRCSNLCRRDRGEREIEYAIELPPWMRVALRARPRAEQARPNALDYAKS